MERIKVGVIVGEAKKNISKIKKIIDNTKKALAKKIEGEDAEIEFERILAKEVPAFNARMLSEDALCELPLLALFDVDEEGNLYLAHDKIFNVESFSLLPEIVALFNINRQASFLILNKAGVSLEDMAEEGNFCFCRQEKGIVKNRIVLEEILEDIFLEEFGE
jgi:hypothetical protein